MYFVEGFFLRMKFSENRLLNRFNLKQTQYLCRAYAVVVSCLCRHRSMYYLYQNHIKGD